MWVTESSTLSANHLTILVYKTMNNTDNTPEPRYPFVPMFANGLPQADFYVNGITAPVLISPRSASGDTRHEWTGYLKIMKRGTYFLSLDADSSISLAIPFKNVEFTKEAKDLSVKPESVVLEQGYYWCRIVHEYHPALGSGQGRGGSHHPGQSLSGRGRGDHLQQLFGRGWG